MRLDGHSRKGEEGQGKQAERHRGVMAMLCDSHALKCLRKCIFLYNADKVMKV